MDQVSNQDELYMLKVFFVSSICHCTFIECASSSLDSSLRLWDLQSGDKLSNIEVGPVDIWTVVFSPDDKFVVSGSHAGKIHLYGVESGKQEQTLDTRGGKFTLSVAYVGGFE